MSDLPETLGNYKIIKKLGSGGMADVYEAVDERLERKVAIKILPTDFARDEMRAERFNKEVLATAKLNHPNIVTIYDVGSENGFAYYTMALLPNGELKAKINQGMQENDVLTVITQIAEALGYAHAKGFVHRDLKPENILFDEHGTAVVTDLGIAKLVGSDTTQTGTSLGTPYYMSPEQAMAKKIDGRSDLYSLGVLIFRMLTREPLFDAEESIGVCLKHIQEPPPPLPERFSHWQPTLDKLLAKDPSDRFQDAGELLTALDALVLPKNDELTKTNPAEADTVVIPETSNKRMEATLKRAKENMTTESDTQSLEQTTNNHKKTPLAIYIGLAVLAIILVGLGAWRILPTLATQEASGESEIVKEDAPPNNAPHEEDKAKSHTDENKDTQPKKLEVGRALLHIEGEPQGAQVFYEETLIGVTPLTLENLPARTVRLRVGKQFFEPVELEVKLEDDALSKEAYTLNAGQGQLTILSEPSGANVSLNGKLLEQKTPMSMDAIQAGEHDIELRSGDAYVKQTVIIEHGQKRVVKPSLTKGELIAYNEDWYSVDELIALAKANTESGQHLLPKDNNALDKYRAVLSTQPNHAIAIAAIGEMMTKIAEELDGHLASETIDKNELQNLHSFIAILKKDVPEFKHVDEYAEKLAQFEQLQEKAVRRRAFVKLENRFKQTLSQGDFKQAKTLLNTAESQYPSLSKVAKLDEQLKSAQQAYFERVTRFSGKMIVVPAGVLRIVNGEPVTVAGFQLSEKEITFAQWDRCVSDGGCSHRPDDMARGRGALPVINVSYRDIVGEFIPWLNRTTGENFRLPNELEWELSVSTTAGNSFSWGASPLPNRANGAQRFDWPDDGYSFTAPVGSFPPNKLGIYDLHGNVSEWTASCWSDTPQHQIADESCARRVVKGGSWFSGPKYLEAQSRIRYSIADRAEDRGFRLAK